MICQPCRLWSLDQVKDIITCGIILHNMIVEERSEEDPFLCEFTTPNTPVIVPNHRDPEICYSIASIHQNRALLTQEGLHHRLMHDLKVHNWMLRGGVEE